LHHSQPAVSAQIKALEDELDLALFGRTPSGMELTFAGLRRFAWFQRVRFRGEMGPAQFAFAR